MGTREPVLLRRGQVECGNDPPAAERAGTLRERSLRGGAIALSAQAISQCIQLVSVLVLARLLRPEDHGLVAMVAALIAFARVFQDLGLSAATIQRKDITSHQLSTLFWVNTLVGTLLAFALCGLAPLVARFYGREELTFITIALAAGTLISSLGVQPRAILTRQMRVGSLALIDIGSMAVALGCAVVVALGGGRYWALVVNTLALQSCSTAGAWWTSGLRPRWPAFSGGARDILRFGANVAGFDIVHYFARNLDSILIARFWGAQQVGLYAKGYALVLIPIESLRGPLFKIAYPALSAVQTEPDRFRAYFLKYVSVIAFLAFPMNAYIFVYPDTLVRLLLGPQWSDAAEMCRILAAATLFQSVLGVNGLLMLALGRADRFFRWGCFNATAFAISFVAGVPWGAKGVALAYCIANCVVLHPGLLYALSKSPVSVRDFYRAVAAPCIACIPMAVAGFMMRSQFHGSHDIVVLTASLPFCALVYLLSVGVIPGGRQALVAYWSYVLLLIKGGAHPRWSNTTKRTAAATAAP